MLRVATFYRFISLRDLQRLQAELQSACAEQALVGTILLAEEGINATLAGRPAPVEAFCQRLLEDPRFAGMPVKFSWASADNPVFGRLKVRIKPEIVSFGQPGLDPSRRTGEHVDWATWNVLLADPDVTVIDVRNDYEIDIGTFPGAVDPGTRNFRDFPAFVQAQLDPARNRRIAMCCTGGVRCEKASAWMLDQGFETVYQLDGGILNYLEATAADDNRFQGECFVFDQRVSVTADLEEGAYHQCFACRRPLAPHDLRAPHYLPGISCPLCYDETDPEQRAAFAERARQVELARARGAAHLASEGTAVSATSGSR